MDFSLLKDMYDPAEIQQEVEWLRSRLNGIGGSDVPVLYLGELFKRRPWHLYIDKTRAPKSITEADVLEGKANANFRRGHTYEPLAIELYKRQLAATDESVTVMAPGDPGIRYDLFRLEHPDHPHRYVNLDGCQTSGYVLEVKSPSQGVCDYIRANGLKDYYQIQGQYQAGIVNVTGCPAFGPGKCKGTIFVIYEPESIAIQVFVVPMDQEIVDQCFGLVDKFWNEHVVPRKAPTSWVTEDTIQISVKGKYTKISDSDFLAAAKLLRFAQDVSKSATRRLDVAKQNMILLLDKESEERIELPDGMKVAHTGRAGRTGFDMASAKKENPTFNWARYERPGKAFKSFNIYGVKKADSDESDLDDSIGTVSGDLGSFARRSWSDLGEATAVYSELQDRAEFFKTALQAEINDIEVKLNDAALAAAKVIQKGGHNE